MMIEVSLSYGAINVLLFCMLEPLLILMFAASAILYMKGKSNAARKVFIAAVAISGLSLLFFILCLFLALIF